MIIEESGVVAQSAPLTFSDGSTLPFDLSFLDRWKAKMRSPTIKRLELVFSGHTLTGGAATILGEDLYTLARKVTVADRARPIFNQVPGKILRILQQREDGDRQVDQSATASASTFTKNFSVPIIFDSDRDARGKGKRLPLIHLTDGGLVEVTFGTPAGATVTTAGQCRLYAHIVDERVREAKSRVETRIHTVTKTEDNYVVSGSLRAAFLSSDLGATAGYTSLSAETALGIDELERPQTIPQSVFTDVYRRSRPFPASDDEFLASTPHAAALYDAPPSGKVGQLPDLDSFTLKNLQSVSGSRVIVTQVIRDRDVSLASDWLGFASEGDYVVAVAERGMVVGLYGDKAPITSFDPVLARRLPVRV